MADPLSSLIAPAVGTAILQRTFLLEIYTPNAIPRLLAVLDAVTEENPEFTAQVTEHPVEDGPEFTDHIQLKNPTLTLKGTISNTPLDLATSIANVAAGALDAISSNQFKTNIINSGVQQISGAVGAALLHGASASSALGQGVAGAADAIARNILLDVYGRRARFNVVTKRQTYTDMVIESMSFPRDSSTGYQLAFELNLKQIRTVSSISVSLAQLSDLVANSASPINNLGTQTAKGVQPQTATAASASVKGL